VTLPLDDLMRRAHAQLLAASVDIDEEREAVPGRSMALTEVDLEVPVGFLAEPVDPASVEESPPELLVTFEEGDGCVSLSFRPRPPPGTGDAEEPAGGGRGTGDDARADGPSGSDGGRGRPRRPHSERGRSDAARRVGTLGRVGSASSGATAGEAVETAETPESAETDATPGDGRATAEDGRAATGDGTEGGERSAVEELIGLGARPRTARLLARHGPPVEEVASAGVHELRASLEEALRDEDDGTATAGAERSSAPVPDVRELSRIVAAAAERES